MKEAHSRPEVKELHRASMKEAMNRPGAKEQRRESNNRPEVKDRHRAACKEAWSDPERRKRQSIVQKEAANRPGVKERQRETMEEVTNRPEVKEQQRIIQKEAANRPGVKERQRATAKEVWSDPERRKRQSVAHQHSVKAAKHRANLYKNQASFPERLVRARLQCAGVHFVQSGYLPGSRHPYDFVLPDHRVIIECDGCWTHGCIGKSIWNGKNYVFEECPRQQLLNSVTVTKWIENSAHELHAIGQGYHVIRLWEHDVLAPRRRASANGMDVLGLVSKGDIGYNLGRIRQAFY